MKHLKALWLLGICLFLVPQTTRATHIVGAELYYECVDSVNSIYDLTLKLYRDCLNGQAPFDPSIYLFVFDGVTGTLDTTFNVPVPPQTPQIQPTDWGPCVGMTPSICVEEGTYTMQVTLPPNANGYNIGWSRCCRNIAISNLANPLGEGITFLAYVPPQNLASCNSMPVFNQVPPVFLCANEVFAFDHSATDADGDSLVYAITDPYTGTNFQGLGSGNPMMPGGNQPVVDPFTNPMGPPPYNNVVFAPGYGFADPFGSGNFVINSQTGFITVTPFQTGIFVFSISVFEYRNGILLSENRRDFQIHVLNCLPQGAPPTISHDLTGTTHSNDTIFVDANEPFCYDITVQDPLPDGNLQAFPVSAPFGTGTFTPPAATITLNGSNPIQGQVCWTPACAYDGQVVELVVGGYDDGDCENVGSVFDTVWVVITAPPSQPPLITPDYTGLTLDGDTIVVTAGTNFCYDLLVIDPDSADLINVFPISSIFNAANPPTFFQTGPNPVNGQVCWTPGCNFEGQTIEISIGVNDVNPCNPPQFDTTTVWVRIEVPPNVPPTINSNLTGNIFSNDTIFVDAEDGLCFSFTGQDADLGDVLTPMTLSPIFNAPNGPTITTSGTNPLSGQICWTPGCQYENQVVPFIFGVEDPGACTNIGQAFDTIYVAVAVPPNDPPQIQVNLNGNTFSNDTIFITAEDDLCYAFTAVDPNTGDTLTATPVSPIFNDPNGPSFSELGINPVTGQVCWTPACDLVGQVIPLVITATDDAPCSSQLSASDTVFIAIDLPPNDPPQIIHDLSGLNFDGDTIFADADSGFCYTLSFTDINSDDTLSAFSVSPLFSSPTNPATFTVNGVNPLSGTVCWNPSCDDEGQLFELIVAVEDNGRCNNSLQAFDTVYIKVSDPVTAPPIVTHDLGDNAASGDTIVIEIGGSACYEFFIADQTTDNGLNYMTDFELVAGLNVGVTSVSTEFRNDSIIGQICFDSDCSNGGSLYRSIVTGLDKATCPPFDQAKDTVYIKVNTDFKSFAGVDTFFCEGSGGVQLVVTPIGGTAPYYYSWTCDDPLGNCGFSNGNENDQDPIVNPGDTTIYAVQITDHNGCTSEFDDVLVRVNKLPIADAGPDTSVCRGSLGTRLKCTVVNPLEAPGPYTYTWTPAAGLNDPHVVDPFANPDSTTIYTVIVGSANGCTSVNTTLDPLSTITVTVKPTPIAETGPDVDICFEDSTQLLGFANGAGPSYAYIWTPNFGVIDSADQTPMASPDFTTTYFLVVWSNGCPSTADSTTIIVHTEPTLTPGLNYELCGGDSVRLDGIAGGDPFATEYSYQWSPGTSLDDYTAQAPMASPDTSTVYALLATSNFGCGSLTEQVPVTVRPTPVAFAGVDTALCQGDSLQLSATYIPIGDPIPPQEPVFYTWSPSHQMSNAFIANPMIAPNRTTKYTVEIRAGACRTTDDILVNVQSPISVVIEADTNRICGGEPLQLTSIGGSGAAQYAWSPVINIDNPGISAPIVNPLTNTTYTVTLTEGVCKARDSFLVQTNPRPEADIFASQTEGCAPLEVQFLENSSQAISYRWQFGDESPISNAASPTHQYLGPGEYPVTLTVWGQGGCSDQDTIWVSVGAGGQAAFTVEGQQPGLLPGASFQFLDASEGALNWFWDFGDGHFSSETNPGHSYDAAGSYRVILTTTDANGCIDTAHATVLVADTDILIPNVFSPNSDGIHDTYRVEYTGKAPFSLKIYDRWGRTVFGEVYSPADTWNGLNPDGSPAPTGVYYYTVSIGEKVFTGDLTLLR